MLTTRSAQASTSDAAAEPIADPQPANHRSDAERLRLFVLALSAPLIYSLIIPLALIDAWISLYQAICFRIYDIPRAERRLYFVFDRARLPYLNPIEKLNCAYCSYANGVIAFAREVAARTEHYGARSSMTSP